jgi:hypothetical protein
MIGDIATAVADRLATRLKSLVHSAKVYGGDMGQLDAVLLRSQTPLILVLFEGREPRSTDEEKRSIRSAAKFQLLIVHNRLHGPERATFGNSGLTTILEAAEDALKGFMPVDGCSPLDLTSEVAIDLSTSGRLVWAQYWQTSYIR